MPRRTVKKLAPSDAVDTQLERYRAMRDFSMTAEPAGGSKKKREDELPFVVQKHAATRLHYDFRLGWRGVLKSWAVAKGPSYYPGDKRLAVQVEDHPMEYGGFEGTIPKGQYGGGTVMVWDQGTWEPNEDFDEGLRTGRLKFTLHGEKLKGKWTLVRMGGKAAQESKPNWLLIKEHDEFERDADETPITESAPDSVVTGRDLDGISKAEDHIWNSKETEKKQNRSRLTRTKSAHEESDGWVDAPDRDDVLAGTPREKITKFIGPQLASQVTSPPAGDDWLHELKLDGYRTQLHIEQIGPHKRKTTIYTRNGLDWTHRMPDIATAACTLPVKSALIDGEVVVLDKDGKTSFADLQSAFEGEARRHLTYFAFDLLHLDGHNLRGLPLEKRKAILEGLIGELPEKNILAYSDHIRARGEETFHHACSIGAEGIVSKLATSPYVSGRSKTWVKAKCVHQQELVIGGFTPPSNGSLGIGSLLLGYYQDGKLLYAGRTGTGFTQASQKMLRNRLDRLRAEKPSFVTLAADAKKDAVWVKPELVAEVQFATWTEDHRVRQASFQGLREDKPAKDVRREEPVSIPKPSRTRKAERTESKAAKPLETNADFAALGVHLTHPEKIFDEDSGLTKQRLAEYYFEVADYVLPHIAGRPLSIVRCPEGSGKPCFFQKHAGQGLPKGVDSTIVPDKKTGKPEEYVTVSRVDGLVGLAQLGVLELHPWGSTNDALEQPDRLIFDLDPDEAIDWKVLADSAKQVRDVLEQLGLESFVKSTGGKGLHVVAPIHPKHAWPEVKDFTRDVARMLEMAHPERYLIKMTKSARKGRIFLDYLRNDRGSTAVAPYSPRARKGIRVALPLRWDELREGNPSRYTVANFAEWKNRLHNDPWKKMASVKQSLTEKAMRAAAELAGSAGK